MLQIGAMSLHVDSSENDLCLHPDGFIRSRKRLTAADRQPGEVNISVKDLATLCRVTLVYPAPDHTPAEDVKILNEGVSCERCSVPPCLPLPSTFALPPVDWIPHESCYDAAVKVPLLVPIEEQASNDSEADKLVEAHSVMSLPDDVHAQDIKSYLGRCSNTASWSPRSKEGVPAAEVSDDRCLVPAEETASNDREVEKRVEAHSVMTLEELVQTRDIKSCLARRSSTGSWSPRSVEDVPETEVWDLVSLEELIQAQEVRIFHRRSSQTRHAQPMSVACDSDKGVTQGLQCANDEDIYIESSGIRKHSHWEDALTEPPLKRSSVAGSTSLSSSRESSHQFRCSTEMRRNEAVPWKHRKAPDSPSAKVGNLQKKSFFARGTAPKTLRPRTPLCTTFSSTQESSPTRGALRTTRTKNVKGILPPPPPPVRKKEKVACGVHEQQILRRERVQCPQAMGTNIESLLGTTPRMFPDRSQSTSNSRTRTQQRRMRKKLVHWRMMVACAKITKSLREWNQWRYNKHRYNEMEFPSTGVAKRRREEREKTFENYMERMLEEAKLISGAEDVHM